MNRLLLKQTIILYYWVSSKLSFILAAKFTFLFLQEGLEKRLESAGLSRFGALSSQRSPHLSRPPSHAILLPT